MEIKSEIKNNIRYQTVKGVIDINSLVTYLQDIYGSTEFDTNIDVFWDLRLADFSSVSVEEINYFINFVGEHWGKEGNAKAAIIAPDDLGFGLSRMYEMLMGSETPSEIRVFRDIKEAEEWISE